MDRRHPVSPPVLPCYRAAMDGGTPETDADEEILAQAMVRADELGDAIAGAEARASLARVVVVDDEALRLATAAIELARGADAAGAEGRARVALGIVRSRMGQPARALDELAAAESLLRRAGSLDQALESVSRQAIALRRLDRLDEARERLEQAVDEARRQEFDALEESTLMELGATQRLLGERELARQCVERAVELARAAGRAPSLATALVNLSTLQQELGDDEAALASANEAYDVAHAADLPDAAALAAGNAAWTHRRRGAIAEALVYSDRAVEALERLQRLAALPAALLGRALDRTALGQMDAATHDAGRALDISRATGAGRQELWSLRILASIQFRHRRLEIAQANLEAALELARAAEATADERVILRYLAETALLRGDLVHVGRCIARARELVTRLAEMGPALLAIAAAHGHRPDRIERAIALRDASAGGLDDRVDASFHLWRATGDVAHLEVARVAIERVLEGLPAPEQAAAWRENLCYRRILEAGSGAG